MQLHTFPWNLPGNSVVLHDINFCKIHNGVVFFVGSPDVTRPDIDNYTFHNAKFILWYIQLSLWYVYLKLCINICHYFFFNYLSGECIPNYPENAWIKSYSFHLHGPCCEVSPFNENRKWQDYVYIQCEYKSTKQKIKHLLREENKVKENKIS